jgi:hypothetical protein
VWLLAGPFYNSRDVGKIVVKSSQCVEDVSRRNKEREKKRGREGEK